MFLCKVKDIKKKSMDKRFPYKFIDGKCWKDEETTMEIEDKLPVGEYLAYVEIDWFNDEKYDSFVFRTYSKFPVDLQIMDIDDFNQEVSRPLPSQSEDVVEYPKFLPNLLKSCANLKSKRKDYSDKGEEQIFRCLSFTDSKAEYGFLYYENNSKRSTLMEYVEFNKM